jgi:TM2 domain-containing membrane protein YozV
LVEKSSAKPAKTQGDNDKLITILLWLFLGGFAAHRWYKGKPAGWNVLFILTAGGFGIWLLVDLVNILTDNF